MNAVMEKDNHAEQNAAAWYGTIAELVAALEVDYGRLGELRGERSDLVDELESATADIENGTADQTRIEEREAARVALNEWDNKNGDEYAELKTAATVEGELYPDEDAVRERIQEGPLSVEVRSGWYSPGGDVPKPEEFCILLSTGGPALRLMGDLDEYGQPTRAHLQYQDWGTPWTDYYAGEGSGEVLLTYAQQFYFGE